MIVPFLGDSDSAAHMLDAFGLLELGPSDELIIADNTPTGVVANLAPEGIRVIGAPEEESAYYARNVAAAEALNHWLLFTDADCIPNPDLLDAYFREGVEPDWGAIAGEVQSAGEDLLSRWASSRGLLSPRSNLTHPYRPTAVTANLLVRRDVWSSLGGFQEGIRSAGDGDFCWRLQEAGWALGHCPAAGVQHVHRRNLRALARQAAEYGAGDAWLHRRYPGSSPPRKLGLELVRCAGGVAAWVLRGRFERAAFKAIDAVVVTADTLGRLRSNAANVRGSAGARRAADAVIVCDCFPRLSETFVVEEARALQRLGYVVRLEAVSRPARPALGAVRGLRINYREDDTSLDRLRCLLWAVTRHPVGSARDLRSARRWRAGGDEVTHLASIAIPARRLTRAGERHVHAHFARVAALDALRLHLLTGVPYSVTAHASHDIFGDPTNLHEKLRKAAFVTTGCEYNVRYLRRLVGSEHADRVHEIVMGVDVRRFVRTRPLPGGRVVVGVGRLIEPKGFGDLVDAIALLERSSPVDRLLLVGAGPLHDDLARRAQELGLGDRVEFLGAREPVEVREIMQGADLLAMPCVVAVDGTRDSMPVVVKEAMALELMVVGTDEVGLPEVIRDEWGRVVPPADSQSLAQVIAELLSMPHDRRAAMGAAGRAHVLEHCNVDRESAKLACLIERAAAGPPPDSDHRAAIPDRRASDRPDLDEVVRHQVRN